VIENWLTVKEAAPLAKMSKQALYAAIREKQFPAIRIGRRIRIDPEALREWAKRSSDLTAITAEISGNEAN
jgi:excisionase family DNA binding protein